MTDNNFSCIEDIVMESDMADETKKALLNSIFEMKNQKVNIMITGATGAGKSSTINALFNMEKAKVGVGTDPETMEIEKYELGNLILWDTPGLGDGEDADRRHAKNITQKLLEKDKDGNALIDVVLVVVDGSVRDMGTTYELVNKVIIPAMGKDMRNRILIAINQADMAMKGRGWDHEKNCPDETLEAFLKEKVKSVKNRIFETTGVEVEPIYYCAGYCDEYGKQRPYNLTKLLYYIVKSTPDEKRLSLAGQINQTPEVWIDDDGESPYKEKATGEIIMSVITHAKAWGEIGAAIGGHLGPIGATVGKVAGTIAGGFWGLLCG